MLGFYCTVFIRKPALWSSSSSIFEGQEEQRDEWRRNRIIIHTEFWSCVVCLNVWMRHTLARHPPKLQQAHLLANANPRLMHGADTKFLPVQMKWAHSLLVMRTVGRRINLNRLNTPCLSKWFLILKRTRFSVVLVEGREESAYHFLESSGIGAQVLKRGSFSLYLLERRASPWAEFQTRAQTQTPLFYWTQNQTSLLLKFRLLFLLLLINFKHGVESDSLLILFSKHLRAPCVLCAEFYFSLWEALCKQAPNCRALCMRVCLCVLCVCASMNLHLNVCMRAMRSMRGGPIQ